MFHKTLALACAMLVGHVAAGFSGPLPIPEGDIAGQQYPVSPNGTVFECTVPVQNDAYAILVSADRFNASHCGLEIQSHSKPLYLDLHSLPFCPRLIATCRSIWAWISHLPDAGGYLPELCDQRHACHTGRLRECDGPVCKLDLHRHPGLLALQISVGRVSTFEVLWEASCSAL
ncbi:hypothetical protein BD626DRAFT_238871 [Schizophyllum amplum]|uniref:Uncharacterized protein n=1 Tax=Schizophyllum amplum TaxID=97359 RepID=A0A550CJP7_9AGAR|nr:hypothetical protein BD626DRAFT_238871 [Auriculariopsis ampla]